MVGSSIDDLSYEGVSDAQPGSPRAMPRRYRLTFGALFVYSPRGSDEIARQSRVVCSRVKGANRRWLDRYISRLHEHRADHPFRGLFDPPVVAVPVPPNSPDLAFWATRHIALALLRKGLATATWDGLVRARSVLQSSTCCRWDRPTVAAHFQSFAAGSRAPPSLRLL